MPPKPNEKRTQVSSFEENNPHVFADDGILKDMQMKLEKPNVLDRINERLIRIESDIRILQGNVFKIGKKVQTALTLRWHNERKHGEKCREIEA